MDNTGIYQYIFLLEKEGVINPEMNKFDFGYAVHNWVLENQNFGNTILSVDDSTEAMYDLYQKEKNADFFTIREDRILVSELILFLSKRFGTNRNYIYDMRTAGRINITKIGEFLYVDRHNAEKAISWAESKRKFSLPKNHKSEIIT